MKYSNTGINGDLSVRNNLTAGGRVAAGDATIYGDLQVGGCIRAPFVSAANMGLFENEAKLYQNYPSPKVGWYAAVGEGFPATLYVCKSVGVWTNTNTYVSFDAPTVQIKSILKDAAEASILDERMRAEYQEDFLKEYIDKKVKDIDATDSNLRDMCRRLATMLMTKDHCGTPHHHHHCDCHTDPDWLWKELLLGINMDTENDVLTIGGVEYVLTRLHPQELVAPQIIITDITQEKYPASAYPLMVGKSKAVYKIELKHPNPNAKIYYSPWDGEEPEEGEEPAPIAWKEYKAAIVESSGNDTYIRAKVVLDGVESEVVLSDLIKAEPCTYAKVFQGIDIDLKYGEVAASESGTISPTRKVIEAYHKLLNTDGETEIISYRVEDVEMTATSLVGATFDPTTGNLNVTPNTTTSVRTIAKIRVTAKYDGYTNVKDISVTQQATTKVANAITWTDDPSTKEYYVGDKPTFAATALDGTVVFKIDGNVVTSGNYTLNANKTIVASVAETDTHLSASSSKSIVAKTKPSLYAISRDSSAPIPTVIGDLTTPNSAYTITGNFTSGKIIDCSSTTTRFKIAWFAIPKAKTLKIEGVGSGDNLTDQFSTKIIDDYKVYYKTVNIDSWTQDNIKLTIS